MSAAIFVGQGHQITQIPRAQWEAHLSHIPQRGHERLRFMSEEHHRVRNFVVKDLPRAAKPLAPEYISQCLHLPSARVNVILDELEKHLVFLARNDAGAVAWAYPVTVEKTPHELTFKSGERLYGA